jgi:hypothetical protein
VAEVASRAKKLGAYLAVLNGIKILIHRNHESALPAPSASRWGACRVPSGVLIEKKVRIFLGELH